MQRAAMLAAEHFFCVALFFDFFFRNSVQSQVEATELVWKSAAREKPVVVFCLRMIKTRFKCGQSSKLRPQRKISESSRLSRKFLSKNFRSFSMEKWRLRRKSIWIVSLSQYPILFKVETITACNRAKRNEQMNFSPLPWPEKVFNNWNF